MSAAVPSGYTQLEAQLLEARERADRVSVELAAATLRVGELERDFALERELRQALEDIVQDGNVVATLERIGARHAVAMEAATIRHERAILDLVECHRREVSARLDAVLDRHRQLYDEVARAIGDAWMTRGTTRPSAAKEHWFLLCREVTREPDGATVVTFKIHSGQKEYIDRIRDGKHVILSRPAANAIDIRQTAKKRMREIYDDGERFAIQALRFSCADADDDEEREFLDDLKECIQSAITAPASLDFRSIQEEATESLRVAFNVDELFLVAERVP